MIEKNKEEILINNNFINLKDNKTLVKIKEIIDNYNKMILMNSMNYYYLLLKINDKPTLFPYSINVIMNIQKKLVKKFYQRYLQAI